MKKFFLIPVIILFISVTAMAQQKNKSLTMDDVDPSAVNSSRENSSTDSTTASPGKKSSRASKRTAKSTDNTGESAWQDRMEEAELRLLDAELRNASETKSSDAKLELKQRKDRLEDLTAEGREKGYGYDRSIDVVYREKYVKLRSEMIKEEAKVSKQPPKQAPGEYVYVPAKLNPRTGKLSVPKSKTTPLVDKKKVHVAETKLEKLQQELQDLQEEGRRAGASSKMFVD